MKLFNIIAILVSLSALFSYLNYRYLRLPAAIGVMLIALLLSLTLNVLEPLTLDLEHGAEDLLHSIDFDQMLLHGMLSFLLFAGALHVNLEELARQRWTIGLLATLGVIGSTFLVGFLSWWIFGWIGLDMPLIYCLVFGALISPTDPIAVLAILKKVGAPRSLIAKITGESLFNDGVAVVVFLEILGIATGENAPTAVGIAGLFLKEAAGGVVFGLVAGALAYWMLKSVNNYKVEVLITLALATGGYALADAIHISAPIAIVVAGLFIGNQGRIFAMSEETREHLDTFWELVDEVLNVVLFVLIGLEVLVLVYTVKHLIAGFVSIAIVLLARLVSVGLPIGLMRRIREFSPGLITILTWSGLRGGISVALALSLPAGPQRSAILVITYVIVVFSIAVQGLTVEKLIRWSLNVGRDS